MSDKTQSSKMRIKFCKGRRKFVVAKYKGMTPLKCLRTATYLNALNGGLK